MSIYVEILIHGDMDELWEKTQEPELHQRWDLRFSQIEYLPREPGQAQKFLYATRIGGLRIEGAGESTGERSASSGQRTSALKFWSEDPKSLIEFGSGYWKYVPDSEGIRFITAYDYRTRFGAIGQVIDKFFFRPLLGWATAWSFDRLRLWIEQGVPPEVSRGRTFIYVLSRLALAFVWLYHGAVPKLIYRNPDEVRMLHQAGISDAYLSRVMASIGWAEVCFALVIVVCWKSRWPLWLTILAMIAATAGVAISSPEYLTAAFNPITLNLAVIVLAVVGLLAGTALPAASNCRRKPAEAEP